MLSQKIIKHLEKLDKKKYRAESKEFIVEGIKGVTEALKSEMEIALIIMEGNRRDESEFASIIELAQEQEVPVEFCGRKDVGFIKNTDTFPGVLAIVDQREIDLEDLAEGPIICLDSIKDPGNLGTIIRTADWFGVHNILLSENSVDPYNSKVVRSTMGSICHVQIFESTNLHRSLETLKNKYEYKIYSLDLNGKKLSTLKPSPKTVYIFGSESHGVSAGLDELIDERYTIEKKGEAESLNVGIAAGILLSKI
jgi:TrmH family RNA methyltransferase